MSVKINKGNAAGLINMTPMIDVVFQLLLFFLVASKFADEERQMKVVLPQASEARPMTAKAEELVVSIDRQGRYFASGRGLNLPGLEQLLRQAAANNPGRQTVILRADESCDVKFLVAAMNACNLAGIRDYRVATAESRRSTQP